MRTLIALGVVLAASVTSAQTRSVYIEELTWPEIKEAQAAGKTAAIIVAGGIEQNGHHMALAKHNVIARYISNAGAGRKVNAYLAERKITADGHAGVAESAQVMFIDQQTLMRKDKYAVAAAGPESTTGSNGDPSLATAEMGKAFLDIKAMDAVEQIRKVSAAK